MNPELASYRELVAKSLVFEGLAPDDLAKILACCHLMDIGAGKPLVTEGEPVDNLYVICEGRVEFFLPEQGVRGQRASRVKLNVLGSGRCFGEYSLIDDKPSSASAQTLVPTRLCVIPRDEFRRILEENNRIGRIVYRNLLQMLVARLRAKDQDLDEFLPGL